MRTVLKSATAMASMIASIAAISAPTLSGLEVQSNAVLLRVNTDATQYTCTYQFTVSFADGSSVTESGQTDPVTKATNHVAASRGYNKAVRSAQLNSWNCSQR